MPSVSNLLPSANAWKPADALEMLSNLSHGCLAVADKVMDAVEAAEKRSLAATSNVVTGAVSRK
jgi:hypothetical protein